MSSPIDFFGDCVFFVSRHTHEQFSFYVLHTSMTESNRLYCGCSSTYSRQGCLLTAEFAVLSTHCTPNQQHQQHNNDAVSVVVIASLSLTLCCCCFQVCCAKKFLLLVAVDEGENESHSQQQQETLADFLSLANE